MRLSNATSGGGLRDTFRRTSQRCQTHAVFPVVHECPLPSAFVAQPIMLHLSRLLAGPNKWRNRRLSRFRQTISFHQEQLAFSQPKEGFAALMIGAVAQHIRNAFRSPSKLLG